MVVHDTKTKDNPKDCWNDDPMEMQFNWGEQESLQLSHPTALKQKLDRCNWGEVCQHELKGVEMRRKRWKKVQEWGQNLRHELRSSGKEMMEVCCSSYRQNLFVDPIAVHFLNLENSATRLARDLVVVILYNMYHLYIYIYMHVCMWCALIRIHIMYIYIYDYICSFYS